VEGHDVARGVFDAFAVARRPAAFAIARKAGRWSDTRHEPGRSCTPPRKNAADQPGFFEAESLLGVIAHVT